MEKRTLIERSRVRAIYPGVLECRKTRPVVYDSWELSPIEEGFVEPHIEKGVEPCVDVDSSG
jgi:hypothetical protein